MSSPSNKILILAFDGLRPDMVNDAVMPNLCALAKAGVRYPNSRAVFPSETRVNQSSLVTGCMPQRHGVVGNKFLDAEVWPDRLINSGDEDHLFAADNALDGKLLDVPSLGEHLAARGLSLAVIGSGTAGGTRILNHNAERLGQFRLALYRPDRSTPTAAVDDILARLGPIPEAKIPSVERIRYATDVYLHYVYPELDPDVSILWFFEPDISYHYSGLGTPDNLEALRVADQQLGRILEHRRSNHLDGELQIITLSDHGHLATQGEPLDVAQKMRSSGFDAGDRFDTETDIVMFCSSAGGCYLQDPTAKKTQALANWLNQQPWCGPVFADHVPGCFALADVGLDHRRAPQVVFIAKSNDELNAQGLPGRCLHDNAGLPGEGGMHGGLHRIELNNWLALSGSAFNTEQSHAMPAGIIDIFPTVCDLLQIPIPDAVQGRVLTEALSHPSTSPSSQEVNSGYKAVGNYALRAKRVGATRYLDELRPEDGRDPNGTADATNC